MTDDEIVYTGLVTAVACAIVILLLQCIPNDAVILTLNSGNSGEPSSSNTAEYPESFEEYKSNQKVIVPPDDKEQALKEIEQDRIIAEENGDKNRVELLDTIIRVYTRDGETIPPLTKEQIQALEIYYPHGVFLYTAGTVVNGKVVYGLNPLTAAQAKVASHYDEIAPKIANYRREENVEDYLIWNFQLYESVPRVEYDFFTGMHNEIPVDAKYHFMENAKTLSLRKVVFVFRSGKIAYARDFDTSPTYQTETDKQLKENGGNIDELL